jgi:hypothetical protein
MKMDAVFRYIAAIYASRIIAQYIHQCRVIVTKLTGNALVPNPGISLALVTQHLDTLEAAEKGTLGGPKGSAADRNAALFVVRGDMRQLRTGVQTAADADIVNSKGIIEGTGMFAVKRVAPTKPALAAKYVGVPGLLLLIAKAILGARSYHWQMSVDSKVWSDLAPTGDASTTVSGLTPATMYYFRFRTFAKAGYSDWSTVITAIAH